MFLGQSWGPSPPGTASVCQGGSAGCSAVCLLIPNAGPPKGATVGVWGPQSPKRKGGGGSGGCECGVSRPRVRIRGGALVSKGTVHGEARDQESTQSHPGPERLGRGTGLPRGPRSPSLPLPSPLAPMGRLRGPAGWLSGQSTHTAPLPHKEPQSHPALTPRPCEVLPPQAGGALQKRGCAHEAL